MWINLEVSVTIIIDPTKALIDEIGYDNCEHLA